MTTVSLDKSTSKGRDRFHVLAIGGFVIFLMYRIALVFYPQPDIGGVEVNIIYFIQRLLDGQSLYSNPEIAPYAIAQYSPLYYYICTGVAKLFGLQADDVLQLFTVSRTVSLVLNLLYMRMVFLVARNIFSAESRKSFYAAVFAFIFLEITSFSRPDSLNHFLFLLSVYFFMKHLKKVSIKWPKELLLAALFSAIALFAKQTSIILPVLFMGWFLWKNQFKTFFLFGVSYALALAVLLGLVHFTLGLELFYKNVVMGVNNGISLGWFKGVIMTGFYYGFGMFLLLLFILLYYIFKKGPKTDLLRFPFAAMALLFVFLNAVALKNGSNPGYYTEWWTLLFIITAYYWNEICGAASRVNVKVPVMMVSFVLMMKIVLLAKPVYKMLIENPPRRMMAAYQTEKQIANDIIRDLEPGDKYTVFAYYYTADSYLSCLLFQHLVMPQMDIIGLAAYGQKTYDYSGFDADLKAGKFKWMLMRTNWVQTQFYEISLEKYELVRTTGGFNIYQYKP